MNDTSDAALAHLAARLGERLAAYGRRITTAESCTGGWIGKVLTDVAGSSRWFETGYIVYGNGAKTALLGVPSALLVEHGAVSEPVVRAMALTALERSGADLAVAVSGIAGPDGGTATKPVGTVWLAWASRHDSAVQVQTRCATFGGNREAVRRATVQCALSGALAL